MTEPKDDFGALAGALAKAQAAFPAIPRDKEVVVKTKTGGEYRFKYAPLDSIISAVRKPLSDNGLALVQLLDDGDLVTMLLHSAGARLSGSVALPTDVDIQGLGSAITYLRRYSIQAILGIATEEDDDGNRAAGNVATPRRKPDPDPERVDQETGEVLPIEFTGKITYGDSSPSDGNLRLDPKRGAFFGFKLTSPDGKTTIPQVVAAGTQADVLSAEKLGGRLEAGTTVTVWGDVEQVEWKKDGRKMRPFQRLHIARIKTPEIILPAAPMAAPNAPAIAEIVEELDALEVPWPDVVKADPA